jgi:hypothetical protein
MEGKAMVSVGAYHLVIEKMHFAKLGNALSVALKAARWMGAEANIFWLRDSVFAATPYAFVGLTNLDLELRPERITKDSPDSFAVSRFAAKRLVGELLSQRAHHLIRIRLVWHRDGVLFKFDYEPESKVDRPALESCYTGSWLPRLTPREYYERLIDSPLYVECELSIKSMLEKMQSNERSGYITFEEVSETVPTISVSRSLLLAFLHAAKGVGNDMFRLSCHGKERAIACRAGDVIAVLAAV